MIQADKILYSMESVINKTPVTADVFLNDFCNNKCDYCSYVRYCEREKNQIHYDDFTKYALRLKELGVKGFLITGGGEPTICDDFTRMMDFLNENNIPWGITTNFNEYREIRPKFLKVSLDCWDEESYFQKRGVHKYNQTRENIIRYAEWKKDNSPDTKIGLQLVLTDAEQVHRFYEANKDLPVDYFTFKPVESTRGCYYKDEKNRNDARYIKEAIEQLRAIDSRVSPLNFKWNFIDKTYDECHAHANQIAMNWNGEIMRCCHRPYDIIGHVMDSDILEKNRITRFDMSRCDTPCRMSSANEIIQNINNPPNDFEFI